MYNVDAMGVMIGNQRKKLGMTQKELAEKLGVSVQAVSKWETGVGFPDITIIPAIAVTLNLSLNELFGALPVETADKNEAEEPFSLPAEGETLEGREELPFSEAPHAPEFDNPFSDDGDDSPELRAHLDDLLDDAEQAVKETRRRIVVRPKNAESRQNENTHSETHDFTGNTSGKWDFAGNPSGEWHSTGNQSGEWHSAGNPSGEWHSAGNTSGEWHDSNRQWNTNGDLFGQFGRVAEDFGEKAGKWAEDFGEAAGKWGEKFGEQMGETLEKLGDTIGNSLNEKFSAAFQSSYSEAGVPREWSFAALPNLSLHISGKVRVVVYASDDGQTHIFARGTKGFLDTLSINKAGDTLRIAAHPIGKSAFSPVECTLEIQAGYEAGNSVEIVCTGAGKVLCTPFYDRAVLSVIGSADLRFGNSRICQASVSGAGTIAVGRCQQLQISVSGAGNASFAYAEDVTLHCSGSGEIRGEHMMGKALVYLTGAGDIDLSESVLTEVSVILSGTGNLRLGTLQATKAKFSLAGDGRIKVFGGETTYLQILANGGGRISAEALSAENADIRLSGGSRLTLHAVRGKLTHSVTRDSQLNIQEYPM